MLSAFMSMMAMDVEAESAYISSNLPDIEFRYCYPVTSIDKTYKTSTTYDSVNISEPSYFLCNGSAIQSLYFDDSNQTRTFTAPDVSGKKFLGWYGWVEAKIMPQTMDINILRTSTLLLGVDVN